MRRPSPCRWLACVLIVGLYSRGWAVCQLAASTSYSPFACPTQRLAQKSASSKLILCSCLWCVVLCVCLGPVNALASKAACTALSIEIEIKTDEKRRQNKKTVYREQATGQAKEKSEERGRLVETDHGLGPADSRPGFWGEPREPDLGDLLRDNDPAD